MRRTIITATAAAAVIAAAFAVPAQAGPSRSQDGGQASDYVVVYQEGASGAAGRAAIEAAGGTIVKENADVGVATVRSTNKRFAAAARSQGAIKGVARNRVIGSVPKSADHRVKREDVEKAGRHGGKPARPTTKRGAEPLANLQWDMKQIHATANGSYRVEPGDKQVRVGILDTGIDASHPDIAPNFNRKLSRNFTTDIPTDADGNEIDGPCEEESCVDPADVDDNDHGTHVASTVGSPRNGLGMAGVAPNVSLVNLRAGQDSGFFFLQPSVDALTFAGKNGIDVVNMSYFIDPWLFNCADNPADSPENQLEQRTIIEATQRALSFARSRGVTLVAAAGNQFSDYTKTFIDTISPDFVSEPGEAPYERTIPPSCISMPSEGKGVISVAATGISTRKSFYSDHGNGYIDVSAPGGDSFDTPDRKADVTRAILAAYPQRLAEERGELNPDGTPNVPFLVRDCQDGTCAYYQYIQGTSMASPHAVGVAALVVSRYGQRDRSGLTLNPRVTEGILRATATDHACPTPRDFTYTRLVLQPDGSFVEVTDTHTCEGPRNNNGFYGDGIVDALRAVKR